MHVRTVSSGDIDALIEMIQEFAVETGDDVPEPNRAALLRHLVGSAATAECLVAETSSREAAGFALFTARLDPSTGELGSLYLSDLFVRRSHRGDGVGRSLMARVASIAGERGYTRIDWSVLNSNVGAQEFYRRQGATRMGDRAIYRLDPRAIAQLGAGIASVEAEAG